MKSTNSTLGMSVACPNKSVGQGLALAVSIHGIYGL